MSAFESQEWESFENSEFNEFENQEWGGETGQSEQFLGGVLGSLFGGGEIGSSSGETQEMELAAELLEVTNEQELEQFLGSLISKAAGAVKNFARSSIGRTIGGALKSVAKTALPIAGGALGNFIVPGLGGAVGSKLGSLATKLFEVELEGLNEQEAEFEIARRYVRFATSAVKNAARAPRNAPPRAVAQAALTTAARRHAPGLVRAAGSRPVSPAGTRPGQPPSRVGRPGFPSSYSSSVAYGAGDGGWPSPDDDGDGGGFVASSVGAGSAGAGSGRWVRRGRKIIILGL